jgi:hypothetical protein
MYTDYQTKKGASGRYPKLRYLPFALDLIHQAYGLPLSIIAASNRGFQKTQELRDQGIGIVFSPGCGDRPFGCAVGNSMTPYPFKTVVGKGFGNHGNAKAGADQGQNRGYFGDFLNNPGTKAVSGT